MKHTHPTGRPKMEYYSLSLRRILSTLLLLFSVTLLWAQSPQRITIDMNKVPLEKVLDGVEEQTDFLFIYNSDIDVKQTVTCKVAVASLTQTLDKLLNPLKIGYTIEGKHVVLSKKAATQSTAKVTKTAIVLDETGEPLMGASVIEKGTTNGVITDIDGLFTLSVPANALLEVNFLGYLPQEIEAGDLDKVVRLEVDAIALGDVVVTALGISRSEKALGYSVSKVDGSELQEVININAVNGLSGKVAGVDIQQANTGVGGSSKVTIRGVSSITGSSQPLYVVDGVPIDNGNLGDADEWGGIDMGDGISSINPNDIESMSVLKGPAAAALYGSRAGNGVILITTKKFNTAQESNFSAEFYSNTSFDQVMSQYQDVQTTYGQGIGTAPKDLVDATYMWSWGEKLDPNLQFTSFDGSLKDYGVKSNNVLDFFVTGVNTQNTVVLSGGNELANVSFSASNTTMSDIVPNSNLSRNSFNLRGYMRMWDKLVVDAKINYSMEDVLNRPYLGYSGANTALALLGLPANIDQSWLYDSKTNEDGEYQYWNSQTRIINPYYALYDMKNESRKDRVMGYASLTYEFTDWLNLKVKSGLDSYTYTYYNYSPRTTPLAETGEYRDVFANTTEINSEFLLVAQKQFNERWYVSGSFGGNIMYYENSTRDIYASDEVDTDRIALNNYTEYSATYSNPHKQINSLYAFVNIGYRNYLYVDVTARNDWSSTLPTENCSYFYPSVTASYILTEHLPALKTKTMPFAKIRASYAEVGGDTDPYALSRSYTNYPYTIDGVQLSTESSSVIPNPSLKSSRSMGYEFGLDTKFLNWRVGVDLTYYNQTTVDDIIKLPVSSASGYSYAYINAGEINNNGWELGVDLYPVKTKDWLWNVRVNVAQNNNKIVKLHENAQVQEIASASWISSTIIATEGGSYGDILGYDFKRNDDGEIVLDENGLPQRSDEQVVLGNGQYKYTGGITSTLNYKGFSMKMLFDFKIGAEILSMTNMKLYQYGAHSGTIEGREGWAQSEADRVAQGVEESAWIATGGYLADGVLVDKTDEDGNVTYMDNNIYVDPKDYWSYVANNQILSPFVYDASYIKLREVSVSYTFSKEMLEKLKYVQSLTLSLTARNLYVLSEVPNIDPESTYSVSNGQGYEYGSLPQRSSYGFNVNLKF